MNYFCLVVGLVMLCGEGTQSYLIDPSEGSHNNDDYEKYKFPSFHLSDSQKIQMGMSTVRGEQIGCPVVTVPLWAEAPHWIQGYFLRQSCLTFGDTQNPIKDFNQVTNYVDCIPNFVGFYFQGGKISFYQRRLNTTVDDIWDSYGQNMTNSRVFFPNAYSPVDDARIATTNKLFAASNKINAMPQALFITIDGQPVAKSETQLAVLCELSKFENPDQTLDYGEYPWKDNEIDIPTSTPFGFYVFFMAATHDATDLAGIVWEATSIFTPTNIDLTTFTVLGGFISVVLYNVEPGTGTRKYKGRFDYPELDFTKCTATGYPDVTAKYQYIHSITDTENYVVLPMSSLLSEPCAAFATPMPMPFYAKTLFWNATHPSRVLVFRKSDGELVANIADAPPIFVTHQLNAYEAAPGVIHADMVTYQNDLLFEHDAVIKNVIDNIPRGGWSNYSRLTIDFSSCTPSDNSKGKLTVTDLRKHGKNNFWSIEYGNVNPAFRTKKYKYAYFVKDYFYPNGSIVKVNADTGDSIQWEGGQDFFPQEPIFLPRPGAHLEDDGVVLVQGYSPIAGGKATVAVLNGKDLKEIVRGYADSLALIGNHNRFYPYTNKCSAKDRCVTKP